MKSYARPVEPIVVTTVFDDQNGAEKYKGVPVDELLKGSIEETIWLLWTGEKPTKIQADLARMIIIMVADHGPSVAGAYSTILATSAGLELPQAVAAGVQMIGPKFGGAASDAAAQFKNAVENKEMVEQFINRLKSEGVNIFPGFGHKVFSRSKPDKRVSELLEYARENIKTTPHITFAQALEAELLKKNEKLILNIDGAIGATLLDLDFPIEGIDGFFVLARTIGLIAHYIDQKQRGTGLIRLPEELVLYKNANKTHKG